MDDDAPPWNLKLGFLLLYVDHIAALSGSRPLDDLNEQESSASLKSTAASHDQTNKQQHSVCHLSCHSCLDDLYCLATHHSNKRRLA